MIYLVIGRRKLGKTTLALWMARRLPKRAVLDPRDLIHYPSAERVSSAPDASEAVAEMLDDPRQHEVIYHPYEDDLDLAFNEWARGLKQAAIEFPDATWAIVIDEASFYDLGSPSSPFQWLAKCTAHERVHIIITAHRPQDVPAKIRAIADHWFIFSIRQEHDLKAVRERSDALAREVEKLTGRDFVHWNDTSATMSVNRHPHTWRVDLAP